MNNLEKRPSKGILKFSEGSSRSNSVDKDIKWDEANIKDTLHPDDKDYGFMRIDEPPTPYSRSPHGHSGENSDNEELADRRTSDLLERVSRKIKEPPVSIENVEDLLDERDPEPQQDSDPTKMCDFELKRKRHYNEFHAVKLAKKLMQKELEDANNDDDEDQDDSRGGENEISKNRDHSGPSHEQ